MTMTPEETKETQVHKFCRRALRRILTHEDAADLDGFHLERLSQFDAGLLAAYTEVLEILNPGQTKADFLSAAFNRLKDDGKLRSAS